MNFLFPSDLLNSKKVDESFQTLFGDCKESEFTCYLLNSESWYEKKCQIYPAITDVDKLIYRGWMLSVEEYQLLEKKLNEKQVTLLNNSQQYQNCHYLPAWYESCKDFTPKTVFADENADFEEITNELNWNAYFIKDYVKSLTTEQGSVAKSADNIIDIIKKIINYRGKIEGGICIREFENLLPETEERYFIYQGNAFSRTGIIPAELQSILESISAKIDSNFFSADIVLNSENHYRLVELGDGQVSDLKEWQINDFLSIFKSI